MRALRLLILCAVPLSMSAQESGRVLLASDLTDGFYGDEAPFSVDGDAWLGLVRTQDGVALAPATLAWHELERAVGVDGPTFELSSSLPGAIAFFSGVSGLGEGGVTPATPSALSVSDTGSEISLGGRSYSVSMTSSYPEECRATVLLSDGTLTQELPVEAVLGCGDPHFTVHWAGDIDGDGRLDLVATFSMKYSDHPRQLYLSSAASTTQLVALAATTGRAAD